MLELFRKNTELYVKVLMNLRIPIKYQNKVFNKGEKTELLLPEQVNVLLTNNGNIKLWNGKKFVKLNLGQFYDIMQRKDYVVIDYVEPKVQVKRPEVKKEEPKVQVKPEVKKEEPKEEVKQPEVKNEEPKEEVKQPEVKNHQHQKNNNNNNKQRHANNNKQGGDK